MTLTVAYHGGTRYDITSGTHRVVTDQPIEDGGQDAAMVHSASTLSPLVEI